MEIESVKLVVRCQDIDASRAFYVDLLGLRIVEEWDAAEGKGCIVAPETGHGGFIELCQVARDYNGYKEEFSHSFSNDKADLQLRTSSVVDWTQKLRGRWPFEGPVKRPWGNTYLWLRDPDGLKVALFEGPV